MLRWNIVWVIKWYSSLKNNKCYLNTKQIFHLEKKYYIKKILGAATKYWKAQPRLENA